MRKFTALLVDDEEHGLRTLAAKIEWSSLPLQVIGTVNSVDRAVQLLKRQSPDFIFLDIKMPQKDGFQLIEHIDVENVDVIFTTAHEDYALKAFKKRASGYLLKPILQQDLNNLLTSLIAKRGRVESHAAVVCLKSNGKLVQVKVDEILYVVSEATKSRLFLENGEEIVISAHLKSLEAEFSPLFSFFRIHHQSIINLSHIDSLDKGRNTSVKMANGVVLDVSRSKKKDFFTSYNQYLFNH